MRIKQNHSQIVLPDFLLVGAARSGTSSLYYYLKQHPQIFLPATKEHWFFAFANQDHQDDPIFSQVKLITSLEDYTVQFKDAQPDHLVGECSTVYLHLWKQTIENILSIYPKTQNPKIVIVLRNPIERAYSHYKFDFLRGFVSGSFGEAIAWCKAGKGSGSKYNNYLTYGLYFDQVKGYLDNFPNVCIYMSERLGREPLSLVKEIFNFLDVDTTVSIDTSFRANVSGIPKRQSLVSLQQRDSIVKRIAKSLLPDTAWQKLRTRLLSSGVRSEPMDDEISKALKDYYRTDVQKLEQLLDIDLSDWLR